MRVKRLRFLGFLLFISFLEKCVHASGVHQGHEENEESCPAPPGQALACFDWRILNLSCIILSSSFEAI
jgi:hypothetical protein